MSTKKTCPACGTELPTNAPSGACPKCLLKAGMRDSEADSPTIDPTQHAGNAAAAPKIGTRVKYFGDYELLDEIARGGMGVVYRARQVRLNRTIALKMILAGQFAGEGDVKRFQSEAEAAAQLDHPGIVPIFEVGEHDGHHFFSMGLVQGDSLAARITDGPLPPKDAALLMRRIADAIRYAHSKGVIHRDLKPANILLDKDGQPRVTDFGLAKRVQGDSNLTATGQVLGTPSYMPPEQASGQIDEVKEPADIYSLGAVLYATLTGRPPFQADNPLDTLMQVLEREPVSPRQLNPSVPQDLETICLKCLQKDRRRRYGSMQELIDELDRFCEGRPILARPISRTQRAWRWCRRNPALAAASGLAVLALVTTAVLAVVFAVYQSRAADHGRQLLAETYLDKGQDLCEQGDVARGVLWMARGLETAPANAQHLQHAIRANLGAWSPPPAGLRDSLSLENGVSVVAFSADGQTFMTEEGTNTALFWETGTLKQIAKVNHAQHSGGNIPNRTVVFNPDGRTFATECYDVYSTAVAQLWDVATGQMLRRFEHPPLASGDKPTGNTYAICLAFSRDGKTLATVDHAKGVLLWDVATGKHIGPPISAMTGKLHTDWIEAVAISPDGTMVATGSRDQTVRLWNTTTGEPIGSALPHGGWVRAISFSPDGKTMLTGSLDGKAHIWDVATGKMVGGPLSISSPQSDSNGFVAVAFSPDGKRLLTAAGHDARHWDTATQQPIGQPLRHNSDVTSVAFFPDGKTVLTGSMDSTARLWDVPESEPSEIILPHDAPVFAAAFSPDGQIVGTVSFRDQPNRTKDDRPPHSEARLWNAATGERLGGPLPHQPHQERPLKVAFSPDDKLFAMLSEFWDFDSSRSRSVVHLWDVAGRRPVGQSLVQKVNGSDWRTGGERLIFSADGETLTATDRQGLIQIWDLATNQPVGKPERIQSNRPEALSPDGKFILCGHGNDNTAFLKDAAKSTEYGWFSLGSIQHQDSVGAIAISPDGTLLLTGSDDQTARIWDAATLKPIGPALTHAGSVRTVAFSPDGRTILTASLDKTARLWRVPPVQEGDTKRLVLWAKVNSGTTLNGTALDVMLAREWLSYKHQLDELGDPPLP